MSRLCRLKTKTHGEDGQWAYEEITKLREQVAAQAAVIERQKEAIAEYLRNPAGDYTEDIMAEALSISTDSTQILDEVRRAERDRVAEFILRTDLGGIPKNWQGFAADGLCRFAAAIRAME